MPDIVGLGSEQDPQALKLFTYRNRHFIENAMPEEDRSPAALRAAREFWIGQFSELTPRSLTAMYNCAGMVFACRRTCVSKMQDVDTVLVDDGYHVVSNQRDVDVGDLVVYRRGSAPKHVGIVYEKAALLDVGQEPFAFRVLSQWGEDGEFLHKLSDVPALFGDRIEFWSDRK